MKNSSILMLISRFHPVIGGAEKQCKTLSAELINKGLDVCVLTQRTGLLAKKEIIENIAVYRIGFPIKGRFGSFTYLVHGLFWILRNITKFDIFHAHIASSPSILGGVLGFIFSKPVFLTVAGSRKTGDIYTSTRTWFGKIKLFILKKVVTKYICLSEEIKNEFIDYGFDKNKIVILKNGVDTDTYKPALLEEKIQLRNTLSLPLKAKIFIYSGRLENGKGLNYLLDAWANVNPKDFLFLLIVGSGSLYDNVKKTARNLDNVILTGARENVEDYLRASDYYILPSLGEGLPNSLLEAMSCGLVCVATKIGGIDEVVKDKENGLLIEPGSSVSITNIVDGILKNQFDNNTIAQNAKETIFKNYSIEKITDEYITEYKKTLYDNN